MKPGLLILALAHFLCLAAPGLAATRYVALNNPSPIPPYTNWPTAATNIQDAIDAASPGDLILVTNGLYNTGSRTAIDSTPCRVVINKPVTVHSLNGPEATVIEGYSLPNPSFPWSLSSVRCAYLTNGASLIGFKLFKGSVRATSFANLGQPAGGVYCESTSAVLSNCVIMDCASYIGGGAQGGTFFNCLITNCWGHIGGGGVYAGNLDHCEVIWNTADYYSGGLYYCHATNCTINYNLGLFGGGANHGSISQCTVFGNYAARSSLGDGGYGGGLHTVDANNSIIYWNAAATGADDTLFGTFTNCCSPGLTGSGNITNEPLFIDDYDIPGNFHLQANSPCINAGNNALAPGPKDLDGRPRIVGPKVDIGAYEFQGADLDDYIYWLWMYYLPTDISSDFADPDGDGMNNWQEWKADTIPTSPISCLVMAPPYADASGQTLAWLSVDTRNYTLERSTNLGANPPFHRIATNIIGQSGITTYTDTDTTSSGLVFYRVLVQ